MDVVCAGVSDLTELLRRADNAHLADRREWRVLLHYRTDASGEGVVSDADDPRFFLSRTGKTDPQAELAATLRAFFSTDLISNSGNHAQPAHCAFIARYRWLKQELQFDERRLPPQSCERFQQWLQAVNAVSATLVFTSAYLNNPASLFGHTLLRLDQQGQTEQTRLLAYAVNYAADDTASHGLMYAVDGITGGFKGMFNLQPYYKLVRTYSDLESRDIWEYRLNLTPSQLQRLLEHIWELRGIQFDYYFFRENCAWQLLTLLEVANPHWRLSDEFTLWVLPPDTIRLLARQPGLIGEVVARPARGTAIRRRYDALSADERRLVWRLVDDPAIATTPALRQLPLDRQVLLLELALDQRQHRRSAQHKAEELAMDGVAHQLLIARHQRAGAATPIVVEPYATQPEIGHASRRLGVSGGQRAGAAFVEINARASYHDLLEADAGYTPDAQIELLSGAVRYRQDSSGFKVNRFTVLDITSLPPFSVFSPRPAWRIHLGWEPIWRSEGQDRLAFNLSGGLGLAAETGWPWRTLWFALPEVGFDSSGVFISGYRAGFGMTLGMLLQPLANGKTLACVTWRENRWGETGEALRWTIEQHWALGQDWALRAGWRFLEGAHEFQMGLLVYF